MDVRQATISVAVMDSSGKLMMECSILRTIEDNFGLDPIHKESGDGAAAVINGIWK
jgi:hypothetical protein